MLPKKQTTPAPINNWRDLPQLNKNRAVSPQAIQRRRRFILNILGISFGVVCSAVLCGYAIYEYKQQPDMFQMKTAVQPLETIYFHTDGVLTREWVESKLGIAKGTDLIALNIAELDEALEAQGQVRDATVQIVFPNALRITVREHRPVMRVRINGSDGKVQNWVVSELGDVYPGFNYPQATLQGMPFLGGVNLIRQGKGYAPIPGIVVVAELLETARYCVPELYLNWRVVLLDDFDGRTDVPWASIKVQTRGMGQVIFKPKDFRKQLNRLSSIMDDAGIQRQALLKKIDLTMENRAAVQYAKAEPVIRGRLR